jgi:hypothetical protein
MKMSLIRALTVVGLLGLTTSAHASPLLCFINWIFG